MEQERRPFAAATEGGSAGLVVLQVALLAIGVLALVWLINIVAIGGDWFPDVAESFSRTTWIAITIPIIALVFIGELLLFFFRRS